MSKEPEAIIQNEILPIIATYYPYSLGELKAFFESRQPYSFDWVIQVCEYALGMGFSNLESAELDMLKEFDKSDIEKKALEEAFEVEELRAEVKRLKLYTDQKLFAAAYTVLQAWDDDQFNDAEVLEEAIKELGEAVTWWDSLPFDPDKDVKKLPKYEG